MKKWVILNKSKADIIATLLINRGLKTKVAREKFLHPAPPDKLSLKDLSINPQAVKKTIKRIKEAIKNQEKVIVYGDYDADGICATAILWEALFSLGVKALPYIPGRFNEGYGINAGSVAKLKTTEPDLKLIITVDNGIVANADIAAINKLGIDVIILDHHTLGRVLPKAYAIIHTPSICAAALAWILARELKAKPVHPGLDLAAIATIADQMPLLGPNRSFAKHGLLALRQTERRGLLALFTEAAIKKEDVGTYEVGYLIAPRINAMGRLEHALDSLRLLCTRDSRRALELAQLVGGTNTKRQKIVDEVVVHARGVFAKTPDQKFIILAHESYHEGVIGLAASKLVDEFYRPAIVISRGAEISKASARSIPGVNIIEAIRKLEDLLISGGGHPMAAGFSLATKDVEIFAKRFTEINSLLLTPDILNRQLKIDMALKFSDLTAKLAQDLKNFEPTGLGNPIPTFVSYGVEIIAARPVGREAKHLKLKLKQGSVFLEAIAFGFGAKLPDLKTGQKVDVVYALEENVWNGNTSLQLKIKDLSTLG